MKGKVRTRSLVVAVMLMLLAGCSGLLGGGGDPAMLYRFGNAPAHDPAPDSADAAKIRLVSFRGAIFPVESGGDRMLTTRASSVAYIADSRWIAPASELFDAALKREFARAESGLRLVEPAEGPLVDLALSVDVRRFEAAYDGGIAPVIVMETNVKLMRGRNRATIGEWTFVSRKPATENRVTSIVSAYNDATSEIIGRIEGTVSGSAGSVPVPLSRGIGP